MHLGERRKILKLCYDSQHYLHREGPNLGKHRVPCLLLPSTLVAQFGTPYPNQPVLTPTAAPCPPPSKLPNAVRPKKGKTSAKKNKAADGSGTSKARRKKLVGRVTGAAATEAPASSLVEPAADAHHVFDETPPR